jgi:hypothetical protein
MFAPRGPQKPKMNMIGINHFKLVHFLEDCKKSLSEKGEKESAHYMEMLEYYFRKEYQQGKPLVFNSRILGL